jgi:hypothetical protein
MSKKTGKIEGSNLRVLAIAYANNRISRDNYIKLRTRQLSALDFGKPLPELPPDLLDINVPNVKIDAPHVGKKEMNKPLLMIVGLVIAIGIGAAAYVGLMHISDSDKSAQGTEPSLEEQAQKLLSTAAWTEQDLETFSTLWEARSDAAKQQARQTEWFYELENEIIKRINQAKLQRGSAADLRDYQERLNALRIFYAELTVE